MPAPSRQRSAPVPPSFPAPTEAEIPPGPHAGRLWRDTPATTRDALTGRTLTRLTHYRGHSHHLAGPAPLWLDGGRRLLVISDREGCGNLFAYDFAATTLTQLTDLRAGDRPERTALLAPTRVTFAYGPASYELDLVSLRIRPVGSSAPAAPLPALAAPSFHAGETLRADRRRHLWLARAGAPPRARHPLALLAATTCRLLAQPHLSPDGARVVFTQVSTGYTQVYAIDTHDLT